MRSLAPHLVLFLLTILSTFIIGGPVYSLAILSILVAHEMGHYLVSRKYGVPSSLPYFIPFPLPPFGTLGAVIRTKGTIPHRKALFDIGSAGPLCGLALAIPAVVIGFLLSEVVDVSKLPEQTTSLGNS
ncbi:MAG TPA: site-2 protease family protein, partial [Thermodesulfobacteriota bacterium]